MGSGMKRCPDCGQSKPVHAYGRNKTLPDGLSFYCRECSRARSAAWYRNHRQRLGHSVRSTEPSPPGQRRCAACSETKVVELFPKSRSASSGYQSYCKSCRSVQSRREYFRRQYGLTEEDVKAMIARQSGLCAICQSAPAVHVDHCHVTGKIRGSLCFPCNGGLGQFKDSPDVLKRAVAYLEEHAWRTKVGPGVYRLSS